MIEVGLREGVWALVVVLSLYLVVILFRLALPARRKEAVPDVPTVSVDPPQEVVPAPLSVAPVVEAAVSQETLNELEIQQLRRDVAQLRTEQDFLRSELVSLRLDVNELEAARARAEVHLQQAPVQPQQYVRPESPQHSEAMLLAVRGMSAAQIAGHCGISVAEAELVCALARAEGGA